MRLLTNISISALILAIGFGGLFVFGRRPDIVTATDADRLTDSVIVQTVAALDWNLPLELKVDGEAITSRVLTVGSEVTGRIAKKPDTTRGGFYVEQDEILFEIDSADYQLEVERLNAQLQEAEAALAAVDVELQSHRALYSLAVEEQTLQAKQLVRMRSLRTRNAATDMDIDTAVRQELTARHAVQTLQNEIDQANQRKVTRQASCDLVRAQLKKAKLDVSRCVVRSPISGRIVDDLVEQGDFVRPGDELVHISDSSRMEIKCSLASDEVAWIWQQRFAAPQLYPEIDHVTTDPFAPPPVACEVAFQFEGATTVWNGYLSRYEGTGIDRDTRMFPCRIVVDSPRDSHIESSPGGRPGVSPPTLLSGMYVSVRIPLKSPVALVQVPVEAVRPGRHIWVVRDDALQILQCNPARIVDGIALLRTDHTGVASGDRVVVSPLAAVYDGMPVRELAEDKP